MIAHRTEDTRNVIVARRAFRHAFVFLAAALALPTALRAEQFTIFDVPDSVGTFPQSINAKSAVTGFSVDVNGIAHGFVRAADGTIVSFKANDPVSINATGWTAGTFGSQAFLRSPQGKIKKFEVKKQITGATATNDDEQVIGDTTDGDGITPGLFRDADGTITVFDAPDSPQQTVPIALNKDGTAAGYFVDSEGRDHGFVRLSDGSIQAFDPSHSKDTLALGINASGQVTGNYVVNNVETGFLREANGKIKTFRVPGAVNGTLAGAINKHGVIAGSCLDDTTRHGFLRLADGTFVQFDAPGATQGTNPVALNDSDVTVGFFFDDKGGHGFLRTP
ncbi:MAG: hypothetical protein JO056_08745 [Alphaproteobacteria bacterium]|nr:hypothetical protein [Alphaproteobacteria bacterium]